MDSVSFDGAVHLHKKNSLQITSKKLYSVQKEAHMFRREIQMQDIEVGENASPTKCARETKKNAKKRIMEIMKENWEAKPMHGQHPERIKKADVDKEGTHN